ncbi:hypothetical protein Q0M94_28345 (plasmid) [Deinococcus radiomollis]|uniref:hypothetical protein n=1 Tax=Deinococcus radiomollis TaxID=468916 RepID=UPI0038915B05
MTALDIPITPLNRTYEPYKGINEGYQVLTSKLGKVTATYAGVPEHAYYVGQYARLGDRSLYVSSIEQERGMVTLTFVQRPDPLPLSPLTQRLLAELYGGEA